MPDTLDYLVYGYAAAFAIFGLLVASIGWRYRSLAADRATLQSIQDDVQSQATTVKKETDLAARRPVEAVKPS